MIISPAPAPTPTLPIQLNAHVILLNRISQLIKSVVLYGMMISESNDRRIAYTQNNVILIFFHFQKLKQKKKTK